MDDETVKNYNIYKWEREQFVQHAEPILCIANEMGIHKIVSEKKAALYIISEELYLKIIKFSTDRIVT